MAVDLTQRDNTRNQSAVDFQVKTVFVFDNRYENGLYKNDSGDVADISLGMLAVRDTAIAGGLLPATALNLADVVGVIAFEGTASLADAEVIATAYCTKGTIDGNYLVLPATVTLDTTVGNKSLRDILEGIGLHVDTSSVEHTKFDN